MRKKYVKSIS